MLRFMKLQIKGIYTTIEIQTQDHKSEQKMIIPNIHLGDLLQGKEVQVELEK